MLENLRQLYDKAVDFCREQSEAVMIGGAVLVILIILIAVIKIARKDGKPDEDLDFDEELYIKQLLAAKESKAEDKTDKEPEETAAAETAAEDMASVQPREPDQPETTGNSDEAGQPEITVKPEACCEAACTDGKSEPKAYGEHEEPDAEAEKPVLPKECKKNVIFPEELIEEIAKVSSKDLQEVEIKIQSAELRIRYAGYRGENGLKEEVKHFAGTGEAEKPPADETSAADNISANNKISAADETSVAAGTSAEVEVSAEKGIFSEKEQEKRSEEVLKERIKPEEMPAKDIKKPGKFGADNFNTTRSGRVFTEEELEKQIRD